jgi:calcineurin-like phosphoesterase family protein
MNTWITSDHHFGNYVDENRNIIKYCNRPFSSVQEMNKKLQENWNRLVSEDDVVYNLGDYVFRLDPEEEFHLNGHIILVRGNHDHYSATKAKEKYCVEEFHKKPIKINYNGHEIKLMHSPVHKENGFINFCGHVHDLWEFEDGVYNVGIDVHGCAPILLDDVIKWFHQNYWKGMLK